MIKFSISKPSKPKLTLNTTYSKLNSHLWDVKKKVAQIAHDNLTLKSKITFYTESKIKKDKHQGWTQQSLKQKQKLAKLYEDIKQQKSWIERTTSNIEQKQFQKLLKNKRKVQQKLKKATKKGIKMQKKLAYYTARETFDYNSGGQQQQIQSDLVIEQLQRQNKQLQILLSHKQKKLLSNKRQIKKMNQQVIYLLQMKNELRKMKTQNIRKH